MSPVQSKCHQHTWQNHKHGLFHVCRSACNSVEIHSYLVLHYCRITSINMDPFSHSVFVMLIMGSQISVYVTHHVH